jgi:SRSO17 transposase
MGRPESGKETTFRVLSFTPAKPRKVALKSLEDIRNLEKLLAQFLSLFAGCFARPAGRSLMASYVKGLLSDVQRKNVEAMAVDQTIPPRTLQRLLDSIAWDEQAVRDRCQTIIATEHAHRDAIGTIDETGTAKSGNHTCGVKRQYYGNRGKPTTNIAMPKLPSATANGEGSVCLSWESTLTKSSLSM